MKQNLLESLRKIIRSEIRNIVEADDMYSKIRAKLNLGDPVTYKVGKGSRSGMLVRNGAAAVISLLKGSTQANIHTLQQNGITFKTAYVNFRDLGKSYLGTGSGKTWTYSLFGKDSEGNEFIYDKYEGGTAGGGQAFVFVNGKKMKASDYIRNLNNPQTRNEPPMKVFDVKKFRDSIKKANTFLKSYNVQLKSVSFSNSPDWIDRMILIDKITGKSIAGSFTPNEMETKIKTELQKINSADLNKILSLFNDFMV